MCTADAFHKKCECHRHLALVDANNFVNSVVPENERNAEAYHHQVPPLCVKKVLISARGGEP
jgi:hypothetical protein